MRESGLSLPWSARRVTKAQPSLPARQVSFHDLLLWASEWSLRASTSSTVSQCPKRFRFLRQSAITNVYRPYVTFISPNASLVTLRGAPRDQDVRTGTATSHHGAASQNCIPGPSATT